MDAIDKINIALARKGMSGAELERLIGVSNSVYSQWNTKQTKPSKKSLAKVAAALGIDVAEIIADEPLRKKKEKPAPESGNEPLTVDEIKKAFRGRPFEELTDILAALTAELQNTEK